MAVNIDKSISTPGVLLTGASSQIGVFAIPKLVNAGLRVFAVSRKGKPPGYPDFKQVQWLNEASAMDLCQNCEYLLSAGPLDLAGKFMVAGEKFKTAIVFSSSSVESKQQSNDPVEKRQILDMLGLESELQSKAENTGLKLLILRPTLIYGCGLDTNISRLASWVRRFGFIPVNGKATGLRQPVHADDLAQVAVAALHFKGVLPQTLSLGGGETLSYSDMAIRIFSAMEKPVRLVRLPEWLFVSLIRFACRLRLITGVNPEMVKRQKVNLVSDDRAARELLDYDPRPFTPTVADFSLPT
jgi:uncharacterized protein YbjT (DUF2867 family)